MLIYKIKWEPHLHCQLEDKAPFSQVTIVPHLMEAVEPGRFLLPYPFSNRDSRAFGLCARPHAELIQEASTEVSRGLCHPATCATEYKTHLAISAAVLPRCIPRPGESTRRTALAFAVHEDLHPMATLHSPYLPSSLLQRCPLWWASFR